MNPNRDPADGDKQGPSHWLIVAWLEGFRRVLETMVTSESLAAVAIRAVPANPGAWADWASPQWCQQALVGVPGATVFLGWPADTIKVVGGLAAGRPNAAEGECRHLFMEVLNQAAAPTSEAISARLERRVSFSLAGISSLPAECDHAVEIEITCQGTVHRLALVPNQQLMDAVSPHTVPPASPSQPQAAEGPPAAPVAAAPGNIDLLMDVELPVCVTFGRTQLLLKDVLKLSSGSIVELNRLANEPVEVMINNYVIARGEVVVVEGNYGVRVTEIVSRQERIRSLF